MTSDQKKFEHLAGCELLAQNSSTPEQRESLLDLAHKWRAMATSQNLYEVAPREFLSLRGHRVAKGAPS